MITEGFEKIEVVCGTVTKPHYIWGLSETGEKVCKKLPTICSLENADMIGMSSIDHLIIKDTIDEIMVDFDLEGFEMPIDENAQINIDESDIIV